jgi:hypothetical protein
VRAASAFHNGRARPSANSERRPIGRAAAVRRNNLALPRPRDPSPTPWTALLVSHRSSLAGKNGRGASGRARRGRGARRRPRQPLSSLFAQLHPPSVSPIRRKRALVCPQTTTLSTPSPAPAPRQTCCARAACRHSQRPPLPSILAFKIQRGEEEGTRGRRPPSLPPARESERACHSPARARHTTTLHL